MDIKEFKTWRADLNARISEAEGIIKYSCIGGAVGSHNNRTPDQVKKAHEAKIDFIRKVQEAKIKDQAEREKLKEKAQEEAKKEITEEVIQELFGKSTPIGLAGVEKEAQKAEAKAKKQNDTPIGLSSLRKQEEQKPEPKPAPEPAINTDAQGNQKSQYNINVTKAFNVDDTFELNEDEQKEFFGKIDQLVKIPDMENYALYLYQITPENVNLDDVHYITALYELSVKLGLLEDVYADSNLLEKYSSYKYSVVKNGDDGDNGKGGMTIQEDRKYVLMEGTTDKPKVQKDNEEKNKKSKKVGSSKDDDERRGPKDMKLNKDENGADKPVIIDVNEYGWENKDKKLTSSTEMDDFRGLGWVVTFKAMQFGSPRYMTMYIKKNGNEKAETQCKKYLEKLSYSEIDIVKIEEIDPYEYVYRNGAAGMKSVEEVHGAAVVNKDIPYLESTKEEIEQPSVVKEGAMAKLIPEDIKRDVKGVLTKLNSKIRNTKQFNFSNECGVNKPQIDHVEFLNCYRTAKVDETVGDTTYKFILRKNDSMMSRMFYSNLQEKLFNYLGTFATKYNMECKCQACPTYIMVDFIRNDLNNPMGYDMDTMINTDEEPVV